MQCEMCASIQKTPTGNKMTIQWVSALVQLHYFNPSQTTNCRLFQIERAKRPQFQTL